MGVTLRLPLALALPLPLLATLPLPLTLPPLSEDAVSFVGVTEPPEVGVRGRFLEDVRGAGAAGVTVSSSVVLRFRSHLVDKTERGRRVTMERPSETQDAFEPGREKNGAPAQLQQSATVL